MMITPYLFRPAPLHIPDGMLSLWISLLFWALTVGFLYQAVRRTQDQLGERQVPLMGVMAAFIFAAQMLNFPVAGGTSGHLLGGTLAAIALGPWAGMLVMTSVVALQALLFQDGGLVVMGANIFNMGILTAMVGFGIYRAVLFRSHKARLAAAGLAAWFSVMASAFVTALQVWLSGNARLDLVVPAMLSVHALIGLGEALITVAALSLIFRTRPDLVERPTAQEAPSRMWAVVGLLVTLGLVILSPLAAADPDGLERVAIDLGFIQTGRSAPYQALPEYTLPLLGETPLSTIAAGALGVLLVFVLTIGLVRVLHPQIARRD